MRRCLFLIPMTALVIAPALAAEVEPAPVSALVKAVDIPYESFTLPNGLRVLVHTDRKAPVVAISVWYHVGSKDEPTGKTGFAHLFEHLMFNGSEHAPNDFFEPLQQIGATDFNGTTWFDRTNYYETVPTGALDRVLFLESDRMGHLLGGIDQAKLDNQRGVVQNEKRQGDNAPFGLVDYTVYTTLFPADHPYRHSTIGSMADLNHASLADVKSWFRAKYGPDNAVIALAGDIDVTTAKQMVTKWFGEFPRGPAITRVRAPVPTLAAPVSKTLKDQVPVTRIMRMWAVEGVNGKDNTALEVATAVLGGLSSSRLDNVLVRGDKSAVHVEASVQAFEQIGVLTVSADVTPGQDPKMVGKKLDDVIAALLKNGPTIDEVRRVATRSIAGTIGGLEAVGGKASTLAEGLLFSGDPAKYKRDMAELAGMTPEQVKTAARKWMSRPVFALTIEPGARDTSAAAVAITGGATPPQGRGPSYYRNPKRAVARPATLRVDRSKFPPVGQLTTLQFPKIERATLSNGIAVFFARRDAVPTVRVALGFDAGFSSDPKDALGTQALMIELMDEGTTTRSSVQIAETQERLGADVSTSASVDRTTVSLFALTPNLAPSLDLLADVVRNPAFAPDEVERLRAQQLSKIASQLSDPTEMARYVLPQKIYGRAHPYGIPSTGTGEAASVAKLSRDALVAFHRNWIRPGRAQIFVVGDTSLAAMTPMLEARFGNWVGDKQVVQPKSFAAPIPVPVSKIYLIDRPGSPQSVIRVGQVLDKTGRDDLITLSLANDVLGGAFLSRINTDLRETKGWSYGVGSAIGSHENRVPFLLNAPVQTDKTGASVTALLTDVNAYLGPKGTTAAELERSVNGVIRSLPGDFETAESVLGALQRIIWLGRPDNYYEALPQKYRALKPADLDATARAAIDPAKFIYVIVGDAAKVRPQLDAVGLPVETLSPPPTK
jgi:zinc protease